MHHAKEVVDAVERIVREEGINKILLSGDDVILPLLRDQMPKHVAEKVVDIVKMDMRTPEHDVLDKTIDALREHDAEDDRERVTSSSAPTAATASAPWAPTTCAARSSSDRSTSS